MAREPSVGMRTEPSSVDRVADRVRALVVTWRDQLVVFGVALVAHGWLVFNTGNYWDDWLLYTQLKSGDWTSVTGMADQLGGIPTYFYVWVIAAALPPPVIGFKVLAFLLIAGSGLLIYVIGRESGLVTRAEALLISCLAVAYPSDHTHVLLITVPYLVYWFLFLLGMLLLMRSESTVGALRWVLRLLALACLLMSFELNSLLVFYAGALLFGVLYLGHKRGQALMATITRELPRRLDLVLAPLAFWFVYRTFFPPNGIYSYYHQFDWHLESLISSARGFWLSGVVAQFRDSIDALAGLPVLWLLLLIAVHRFWSASGLGREQTGPRLAMLGFGLLLAVLAVFPYIAVGLAPNDHGWSSRHTILLGVPIAIVTVAGVRILFPSRSGALGTLAGAILASLVLGFTLDSASTYIGWEARWLKDSSVIANLSSTPGADRYSVYWITDSDPVGGEAGYRFYEWASILNRAFGGQSRVGLDTGTTTSTFFTDDRPFFTAAYNLASFDPGGCEAAVSISRGPTAGTDLEVTARYVFYSLTDRAKRDRWMGGLTMIKVVPYAAPQATDCSGS